MKKTIIIVGIVIISLTLLFGAFLIINGVQRDQAYRALRSYVYENSQQMSSLANKQSKRLTVDCEPKDGLPGKCQATEYEVTEDECLTILSNYKSDLFVCSADIETTYQKQAIHIAAGDLHDQDKLQLRFILNEKHLLYEYK
jgi:hypothetical protein